MKSIKYIVLFILIILNINLVLAGQIYDLDFSKDNIITKTLNERDVARFTVPYREYDLNKYDKGVIDYKLINKEHKVMVRELVNNKDIVRITVFIQDAETPQYLDLGFKNSIRLDFDRDNLEDMAIKLNKINGKEVTLTLEKIQEDKKTSQVKLFGINKLEKKETKSNSIIEFFKRLFATNQTKQEDKAIAGDGREEKEVNLTEGTARPKTIDLLAENWVVTSIVLIIILIIAWNRRYIRRKLRRLF